MATFVFAKSRRLTELLRQADPVGEMFVMVHNSYSLVLGSDPLKPTIVIDLSKESTHPYSGSTMADSEMATTENRYSHNANHPAAGPASIYTNQRSGRNVGAQWFELNGKKTECRSVKELLTKGLCAIESERHGTLEKLSHIKKRTKRIVARERSLLFSQPHLVNDYSEQLMNGWWVGTNNSSNEVGSWLKQAVSCAGLQWGKQFRTSL